jgi:hypothetical protein
MAKFLAVYTGSAEAAAPPPDEATIAKGLAAWTDWMTKHAGRIVEAGGPLGSTKKVTRTGIADIRNGMAGYVILEADSHEAAARMFEGHPHFAIFPGEGVEIMPVLPIPGS